MKEKCVTSFTHIQLLRWDYWWMNYTPVMSGYWSWFCSQSNYLGHKAQLILRHLHPLVHLVHLQNVLQLLKCNIFRCHCHSAGADSVDSPASNSPLTWERGREDGIFYYISPKNDKIVLVLLTKWTCLLTEYKMKFTFGQVYILYTFNDAYRWLSVVDRMVWPFDSSETGSIFILLHHFLVIIIM